MSDAIKHECGIAVVRLLKPLQYYKEKYGTPLYGLNKLYLLMQKQHNRGQDGAGVGVVKLGMTKGQRFMSRYRSNSPQAISDIFQKISSKIREAEKLDKNIAGNADWLKKNVSFVGELMMGHLRYGTHGKNEVETCHPFIKNHQSSTRSLIMCGNFNLTNIDRLGGSGDGAEYDQPDTAIVLDHVSNHLEEEINRIYQSLRHQADTEDSLRQQIAEGIDFARVLRESAQEFDGGYNMAGLTGAGHAFVMRDPNGIRPGYYYADDEVVVIASERPAIQTAFNISVEKIHEVKPGNALIVERDGSWGQHEIQTPGARKSCSFERIYFSRGSDVDIYNERKKLGELLMPKILDEIEHDYENTVFSFIPNTAEVAFYGMIKGGEDKLNEWKKAEMRKPGVLGHDALVDKILSRRLKIEKIAIKDIKLRTFITQDADRNEMVAHVYDITYGSIRSGVDSMVVIDDSIVRGTTLKESIIKMLDRLGPKKIVIVSSAPQIRYPDCYGIDMSRMKDFVAFRAAVELLKERGMDNVIDDVYDKCLAALDLADDEMKNEVKAIYAPFTAEEISDKCAELLTEPSVNAEVKIIFQSIENLHDACPSHQGDWYFTGNYPTPGGNRVVNRAFVNYMQGVDARAY